MMQRVFSKTIPSLKKYPWREHNRFGLLVDGESFYPAMLDALAHAQHSIFLEQYLIQSGKVLDKFIHQLLAAAQRGVKIFILLDDYGSRGIHRQDFERLAVSNITIASYNPFRWRHLYHSLRRNHRKLLIVDHRYVYTGGAGISDNFNAQPQDGWHDLMLQIEGELVADWYDSFKQLWQQSNPAPLPDKPPVRHDQPSTHQAGRLLLAQGPAKNQIQQSIIRYIKRCHRRVWLATPYFLTTRKLRHSLILAARRNVDVRLLLPGPISDHPWVSQAARRYYSQLLRNGIRIFEYQPRFIHSKLVICDDWVSIGSSNLDRWNQFWNLDANLAIDDGPFLNEVLGLFEHDLAASEQIEFLNWQQRPWQQRLLERWAGINVHIIQWLVLIFSRRLKKADQPIR